ncbi:MAG: response regulator [Myxococcota bacterium]
MRDDLTDPTVEGLVSAKSAEEGRSPRHPYGILVVEADPDLQWRMARVLTIEGNRVVGTSSGDGALALIDQWDVDLVLVDEDLPGMDGLEVVRRIAERQPGVPVILITDEDGQDVQVAARLAGATSCVRKPIAMQTVRDLLRHVQPDLERAAE